MENHGLRLSFRAGVCHRLFRWPNGEPAPAAPAGRNRSLVLPAGRPPRAQPRCQTGSRPQPSRKAAASLPRDRQPRFQPTSSGESSFYETQAIFSALRRASCSSRCCRAEDRLGRQAHARNGPPAWDPLDRPAGISCSAFPLGWALVGGAPDGGALRGPFGGPAGAVAEGCSLIRGHLPPDDSPGASDSPAGG